MSASLGKIVLPGTAHTFLESQRLCESSAPGAHLAAPTSAYSNFKLSKLLRDSKYERVWLGIGDYDTEGAWKTTRGDAALYARWSTGQPDNGAQSGNEENCVEMWTTGEWNDASCSDKKHYACQIPSDAAEASPTRRSRTRLNTSGPMLTLRNGVKMPTLLLGAGGSTWQNEQKTEAMVDNALRVGFPGLDGANHYRNHAGVARGLARARQGGYGLDATQFWLQTKIEGCGNSVDPRSRIVSGACRQGTLDVFSKDLETLGVARLDMALLHAPPCVSGAPWNDECRAEVAKNTCFRLFLNVAPPTFARCPEFDSKKVYPLNTDCNDPEPCKMIQEQWRALESVYEKGLARSIGVSNYCTACLRCIQQVATVMPHVNQLYLHAGMGGPDPGGLISSMETDFDGMKVQAYRPNAQGRLLRDPAVQEIAMKHQKSTAQVTLRWIIQLGHAAVTTTENPTHMKADMGIYDWALDDDDMQWLNELDAPEGIMDNIVGGNCKL